MPPEKRVVPRPVGSRGDDNHRPTVRPPFDMEAYARRTTGAPPSAEKGIAPMPSAPIVPKELAEDRRAQPPLRAPRPRSLSPNSIEGALIGIVGASAAPVITERAIDDPVAEMCRSFLRADYAGALALADLILADDPENADAIECKQQYEALLRTAGR